MRPQINHIKRFAIVDTFSGPKTEITVEEKEDGSLCPKSYMDGWKI